MSADAPIDGDLTPVHLLVEERARQTPGAVAIEDSSGRLTYGDLVLASGAIAELVANEVAVGEVVGVLMDPGAEYIATILGILRAGAAFLPLAPGKSRTENAERVRRARPPFVCTTPALRALCEETCGELAPDMIVCRRGEPPVRARGRAERGSGLVRPAPCPGRAYVLFTSGSTNRPKGIEGCHRGFSHFIAWEQKTLGLGTSTRCAQIAPITFDVSLRDIFAPLASGGVVFVPEVGGAVHPRRLLQWLVDARVTLLHIVPSLFRLLTREARAEPVLGGRLALRHILLAGERLYARDVNEWREAAGNRAELFNLYGPSETTLAKCFYRIPETVADPVPLGRPLPGAEVLVLRDGAACANGEIGELYIRTAYRALGYFGDPELSAQCFVANPLTGDLSDVVYRTGDLGAWTDGGQLIFHGRVDDQVKIAGHRVEPRAVEDCLRSHPRLSHVAVLGVERDDHETELVAFYSGELGEDELAAYAAEHLPEYLRITRIIRRAAMPFNDHGKLDRASLRAEAKALEREAADALASPALPSDDVGLRVRWWWAEALKRPDAPEIPFAAAGGTSLGAMRLLSRLYHDLGLEISTADVFGVGGPQAFQKLVLSRLANAEVPQTIPVVAPARHYELSLEQLRMFNLAQFEAARLAYNEFLAFEIRTALDVSLCERVLQTLVERHDSLRTRFTRIDGGPVQIVDDFDPRACRVDVISFAHETDPGVRPAELTRRLAKTPFDLSAGPPWRVTLVELSPRRWVVLAVFFHIIMDQWSCEVLVRQAGEAYLALAAGRAPPGLPPRVQYKDYAASSRLKRLTASYAAQSAYWKEALGGNLPVLDIRGARRRPPLKRYRGATARRRLHPEVADSVAEYARQRDVSRFVLLLAFSFKLLHSWSGSDDLILGVPVSVRSHVDLEETVGLFLNTVAVRVRVGQTSSFEDLLAVVRATWLGAAAHEEYAYEDVLRDLGVKTSLSRSGLFDALVGVFDDPLLALSGAGAGERGVDSYPVDREYVKFDLSLFFIWERRGIEVVLEYSTDLFTSDQAQALADDVVNRAHARWSSAPTATSLQVSAS